MSKKARSDASARRQFWTNADAQKSLKEGWSVFQSNTGFEIQTDQEELIFPTDEDAMEHVAKRALEGSELHIRALAVHAGINPEGCPQGEHILSSVDDCSPSP